MSTNRWVNPVNNNILRDDENNVLASGSVEFFEAGTSTPINVYSDAAQTVSLGSYLDADAFGLLPDFHLPAGTQVKAVAYDAIGGSAGAGSIMWTRDVVFSADSSTDTRLDTLETTVGTLGESGRNVLLNGGMRVSTGTTAPSLSTSFQSGVVSLLWGKVDANVTAGTLTQGTSTDYASGHYAHFSGVSTSGSANVVAQFRIGSDDAARFVDNPLSFQCVVYQDTGGAINYTITVKKCDAADNFSSLTTIGTDSAQSVSDATDTAATFSVADMGDCSNGIAIEVSAAVGTITTKNFRITSAQAEPSATTTAFSELPYDVARAGILQDEGLTVVQLTSVAATATTSIDLATIFSDNPSYKYFRVVLESMCPASADRFAIRVSIDGSTFRSTASDYYYKHAVTGDFVGGGSTSGTYIALTDNTVLDSSADTVDATIDFINPHDATYKKAVYAQCIEQEPNEGGGGSFEMQRIVTFGRFSDSVDDLTGFQLISIAGSNFAARGTLKVFASSVPF